MLSENLKRYRTEQRYTRKQLAELVEVNPRTIELIENGKNENPGIKTVERLAKVLKVPIAKLIK